MIDPVNDQDIAFNQLNNDWHDLLLTDYMFIMRSNEIGRAHDAITLIKDRAEMYGFNRGAIAEHRARLQRAYKPQT
jgi:hypothetical protein